MRASRARPNGTTLDRVASALAAVVVATAGVAACSASTSGGGTPGDGTTGSSAVTGAVPSSSRTSASGLTLSVAPPPTSAAGGGGLTQVQAEHALLTAAQVGDGFVATRPDARTNPLPCAQDAPPLDEQFRSSAKAHAAFMMPNGAAELDEEIITYPDAATAARALAAGEKGLSCRSATLKVGGRLVTYLIDGPTDLTTSTQVTVDRCLYWSVTVTGAHLALEVARLGQHLVVVTAIVSDSVDMRRVPSMSYVVDTALAKVKAAI